MQYKILQVVNLRNIGGLRIDEFTRRVMPYVMVNNLAMQYNLFGRNRKRAFTQSCLFDIFYSKFYILYRSCAIYRYWYLSVPMEHCHGDV